MSLDVPSSQGLITVTVRLDKPSIDYRMKNSKGTQSMYPYADRESVHAATPGQLCFVIRGSEKTRSLNGRDIPSVITTTNGLGDDLLEKFKNDRDLAEFALRTRIQPLGFVPPGIATHPNDPLVKDLVFSMGIGGTFRGTAALQDIPIGSLLMAVPIPQKVFSTHERAIEKIGGDQFSAPLSVIPIGGPDRFAQIAIDTILHANAYYTKGSDYIPSLTKCPVEQQMFANSALSIGNFILTCVAHGTSYLIRNGFVAPTVIWNNDADSPWMWDTKSNDKNIPVTDPTLMERASAKLTNTHDVDVLKAFADELIKEYNDALNAKLSGLSQQIQIQVQSVMESITGAGLMEKMKRKGTLTKIFKGHNQSTAADAFLKRFLATTSVVNPHGAANEVMVGITAHDQLEMKQRASEIIQTCLVRQDVKNFKYGFAFKKNNRMTPFEKKIEENQLNAPIDFITALFDGHVKSLQQIIGVATRNAARGEPYEAYCCR